MSDIDATDRPEAPLPAAIPKYSDIVLTDEDVAKAADRWPESTPGQQIHYMKQSKLAKLRHEVVIDDGSGRRAFGGVQPGSGRRKRLDETLVAATESRQREIIDAAFAPLAPGNDPFVRHRAAMNLTKEAREVHRQAREDDELDNAPKEDLVKEVAAIMAQMVRDGEIDINNLEHIVDADVVDA